ncbi:hypothetical protein shim_09730 [Shimia sp. SK013]|nr:hypothetical protein shim_09730 [Shimia sp. SK013]
MIPRLLPDRLHGFFVSRLGRQRADRLYVFYYRFAGLILFGGLLATAALAFVILFNPPQMTAQNHIRVPVQAIYSKSSESTPIRVFATVQLPNGNHKQYRHHVWPSRLEPWMKSAFCASPARPAKRNSAGFTCQTATPFTDRPAPPRCAPQAAAPTWPKDRCGMPTKSGKSSSADTAEPLG